MNIEGERAAVIIIQNNRILLMHRFYEGIEYYVFPGGGVEEGESPEDGVIRELKEEFCIDIKIDKKIFELLNTHRNRTRKEYFYFVTEFAGTPALGGEELEKMNDSDQYEPAWVDLEKIKDLPVMPEAARKKVIELFCK